MLKKKKNKKERKAFKKTKTKQNRRRLKTLIGWKQIEEQLNSAD